ncbi:SAF domain-containing protein [Nocardioides gansuensis]|nr:SAF domain-containing protein [Nocardioides gansuensis]
MSTETTQRPPAGAKGRMPARRNNDDGLLAGGRKAVGGPQQPRTRSWGLVTLAALLVIGSGLTVAAWGLHAGEKVSVLVMATGVAKGQVVEREDLASRAVAGVSDAIAAEAVDTVIGQTAVVDLVQGQILTAAMLTAEPVPGPGESMIGLALDPTRVPGAGLEAGDQVDVIAVPGNGSNNSSAPDSALDDPVLLASGAQVYDVGGEAAAGGQLLVTLIVDESTASKVAAYSTQNRVAVVETAPTGMTPAGE